MRVIKQQVQGHIMEFVTFCYDLPTAEDSRHNEHIIMLMDYADEVHLGEYS